MRYPWIHVIDGAITFRHTLWHFIWGILTVVDGLSQVVSLGFISTTLSVQWITSQLGTRLFDHQGPRTIIDAVEQMLGDEDGSGPDEVMGEEDEQKVREHIASALGIPVENIHVMEKDSDEAKKKDAGVLVVPKDKERWH